MILLYLRVLAGLVAFLLFTGMLASGAYFGSREPDRWKTFLAVWLGAIGFVLCIAVVILLGVFATGRFTS